MSNRNSYRINLRTGARQRVDNEVAAIGEIISYTDELTRPQVGVVIGFRPGYTIVNDNGYKVDVPNRFARKVSRKS